jgi:ribosomal-protein-alanine N-acetyltransferase
LPVSGKILQNKPKNRLQMTSVELDYTFRKMKATDLPKVLNNERRSYTHPWTEGIFSDCIHSGYQCWLLLYRGKIIGHGILSVAAGESHLLNACVHPDYQGQGLGRVLVDYLLARAAENKATSVFLEVRPSNLTAYKLYESMGFNEVGIRRDYYPAFIGREDALVLAKELLKPE